MTLKIGDFVKLTDNNKVYENYQNMALRMNLKYFVKGTHIKDDVTFVGQIIDIKKHDFDNVYVAGIRNIEKRMDIIVDINALEIIYTLNDDNFTI